MTQRREMTQTTIPQTATHYCPGGCREGVCYPAERPAFSETSFRVWMAAIHRTRLTPRPR